MLFKTTLFCRIFYGRNAGYSLVGLLSGIGVTTLVIMAASYMVVQTKSMEVRSDLQSELDRSHLLSLQKTRSINFIKKHLNLHIQNSTDNVTPGTINTALLNCLSGAGTNCNNFSAFTELVHPDVSTAYNCTGGPGCSINSDISYRGICNATACSAIEFRLVTSLTGLPSDRFSFQERMHTVTYPRFVFAGKANINFACANASVVRGVDLQNLQALCGGTALNNCNGSGPLRGYALTAATGGANCPALVATASCATGVGQVGLFSGQAVCNGP